MSEFESPRLLNEMVNNPVQWLDDSVDTAQIAISSRIRLARNISGYNFPGHASIDERERVYQIIHAATKRLKSAKSHSLKMTELNDVDRNFLLERHIISQEHVEANNGSAVIFSADELVSLLVNEEDHLRIQYLKPGLNLKTTWRELSRLDTGLSKKLQYSFSNQLGFLTSCPSNVGTGMRASVMLHLPALVLEDQMHMVVQGLLKLGFVVRGLFGEGTESLGNLFQISNQCTLGLKENKIIESLEHAVNEVIKQETVARHRILQTQPDRIYDFVGRAYGILENAYSMSSQECLTWLSAMRLGVDIGMFSSIHHSTINHLMIMMEQISRK